MRQRSLDSTGSDLSTESACCLEEPYKVAVLGAGATGKSSILSRFFRNEFSTTYTPTEDECHMERVRVDEQTVQLEIFDTAGSHYVPAKRDLCIKKADVFVLVYTAGDAWSFEVLKEIRSEIICRRGWGAPMVIVGNKCDIRPGRSTENVCRELTVSCDWGNSYVECSAAQDVNMDKVFLEMLKALQRHGCALPNAPENISVLQSMLKRSVKIACTQRRMKRLEEGSAKEKRKQESEHGIRRRANTCTIS